jgi:hypothetical protein
MDAAQGQLIGPRSGVNDSGTRYLRWSSAVDRLSRGMWTGMAVPDRLQEIRRKERKLRVRFGPRREDAGKRLMAAATRSELPVYLVPDPGLVRRSRSLIRAPAQVRVLPLAVLKRLIAPRGTLPNHAYRPSLRACEGDKQLLFALETGFLAVQESEFDAWYRFERRRGKWPSQRSQTKRPQKGRPTKETARLRDAIIALVREGHWTAKDGLNALHHLLKGLDYPDPPKSATLGRVVDRLCIETGEEAFRRAKQYRRKRVPDPNKQKMPLS